MNARSADKFPATVFVTQSLTLKPQSCAWWSIAMLVRLYAGGG